MTRVLPTEYPQTTPFYEQRGDHIHGAIDIGAPSMVPAFAPEKGTVFAWVAYRPTDGLYWPDMPPIGGAPFTFGNYFYDMYGGVVVLIAEGGKRTHIISHMFAEQLFDNTYANIQNNYYEEKAKKRFPLHCLYTDPVVVEEGQVIGLVGDSGKSSGPHVHWEIHRGTKRNAHNVRINPENWFSK